MGEIAKRAAAEIRRTAQENDLSYQAEFDIVGVSRNCLYEWEHSYSEPTAKKLAGLALAGYDIYYILTGQRRGGA